jgi:hypothetical protein
MGEFIFHWTAVNAAVTPDVLVLKGGYGLADFIADADAVQAALTLITSVDNSVQINASDRDKHKKAARGRIGQYRAMVLGLLADTPYAQTMPKVPPFESKPSTITRAMDEIANGWSRINTEPIRPGAHAAVSPGGAGDPSGRQPALLHRPGL